MKTLTYSIKINKPPAIVFDKMIDRSIYPHWAKAWGEGMNCSGEWKEGENISFFDKSQGGTKMMIERIIHGELVEAKHIAMVNPQNLEIELTDDMMKKWIGSRECYYFKSISESQTMLEVVVVVDEVFEAMMGAWPKALDLLKGLCEK